MMAIIASLLLGGNIPSTAWRDPTPAPFPGLLDPTMPPPLKDPNAWIRAMDPNNLSFDPWRARAQTLLIGTYSQARLISHVCGCMEFPLPQGRAVLPCRAHDKRLQAMWYKADND